MVDHNSQYLVKLMPFFLLFRSKKNLSEKTFSLVRDRLIDQLL